MDLSAFELAIIRADGSQGNVFKTKEDKISIGQHVTRDIRIKIPEADPYMCKITADPIQKGRVRLTNCSKNNPVKVNGIAVQDKVYIKHMDEIDVVGKKFIWRNIHKKNGTPGPSNLLTEPQSAPQTNKSVFRSSVARIVKKRFTFATTDNEKISTKKILDEALEEDEQEEVDDIEQEINNIDEETKVSTTPLVNKENHTPSTPYEKLNMSGTLIVSCTPRAVIDTGLRTRRNTLKLPETPSEPYGTPKSVLSEFNNEALLSTSHRYTPKSSMHLIDFTTPHPNRSQYLSASKSRDKLSPAVHDRSETTGFLTPVVKSSAKKGLLRSALKNSAVKPNTAQLKKKLSLAFEQQKDVEKTLLGSPQKVPLVQPQSPNLVGIRELMSTPQPIISNSSGIEGVSELSVTLKPSEEDIPEESNYTDDAFDKLIGKSSIKNTYERKTKSFTSEEPSKDTTVKPDVADWIDSVMAANTLSTEEIEIQPNEKSQVLSNRFSDITNESMQNMTGRSTVCYTMDTSMLGVSPISKINVTDDGVVETSNVFSFQDVTDITDASLRSTRKRIGQALTSLNTSGLSEIDQNDESLVIQNDMDPINEETEDENVEYVNLEIPPKDIISKDSQEIELNNSNSPIKSLELENLSDAPTSKNKRIGFTTPQATIRPMKTIWNTVASKPNHPDRPIDRQYMLQQNLKMRLQKTDEETVNELTDKNKEAKQSEDHAAELTDTTSELSVNHTYELNASENEMNSSTFILQNQTFTTSPQNKTIGNITESTDPENNATNTEIKELPENISENHNSSHETSEKTENNKLDEQLNATMGPPVTESLTLQQVTPAPLTKTTDSQNSSEASSAIIEPMCTEKIDETDDACEQTFTEQETAIVESLTTSNVAEELSPTETSIISNDVTTQAGKELEEINEHVDTDKIEPTSLFTSNDHIEDQVTKEKQVGTDTLHDSIIETNEESSVSVCESEIHNTSQIDNITLESTFDESYIEQANKTPKIIATIEIPDTPVTFIAPRPPLPHYVGTPRPPLLERDSVYYVGSSTPKRNSVILIEDTPIAKSKVSRIRESSIVYEPTEHNDESINEMLDITESHRLSAVSDEDEKKKLFIQDEMQNMEENPTKKLTSEFKTPQLPKRRTPRTPRTVSSLKDLNGKELSPLFEQEIADHEKDSELKNLKTTPKRGETKLFTPQPIRRTSRNANRRISALDDYKDHVLRSEVASEIIEQQDMQRDARHALALMKEEMENMDTMPKLPSAFLTPQNQVKKAVDTVNKVSSNTELRNVVIRVEFANELKSTNEANLSSTSQSTESDKEVEEITIEQTEKATTKRKLYTPSEETPKSMEGSFGQEKIRQAYFEESIEKVKRSRRVRFNNDATTSDSLCESETQPSEASKQSQIERNILKINSKARAENTNGDDIKNSDGKETKSSSRGRGRQVKVATEGNTKKIEDPKPNKRGRKKKPENVEDKESSNEATESSEIEKPAKRGRRNQSQKTQEVETEINRDNLENDGSEEKIEKNVKRRRQKKEEEVNEETELSEREIEQPRSKRGRAKKEQSNETDGKTLKRGRPKKEVHEEIEQSETEAKPPKAKRGRPVKEQKVETERTPLKRGRKKKVVEPELVDKDKNDETVSSETEVDKPQPKRPRGKKIIVSNKSGDEGGESNQESKQLTLGKNTQNESVDQSKQSEPLNRPKRGRQQVPKSPKELPSTEKPRKARNLNQEEFDESELRQFGNAPTSTPIVSKNRGDVPKTETPKAIRTRGKKPIVNAVSPKPKVTRARKDNAVHATERTSDVGQVTSNSNVQGPNVVTRRGKKKNINTSELTNSKDRHEDTVVKSLNQKSDVANTPTTSKEKDVQGTRGRGRKKNMEPTDTVIEPAISTNSEEEPSASKSKEEATTRPRRGGKKRKSSEVENAENERSTTKRLKEDLLPKRTTRARKY